MKSTILRWQLALFACLAHLRARATPAGRPHPTAREGQSFLEYAIVLAVIAVIVLVAVQAFGTDLAAVFDRIRNRLTSLG